MPEFSRSMGILVWTPIRTVQAFTMDAANEAGLPSSRSTLAATIVSDLVRSVRYWCKEGEGELKVSKVGRGIGVELTCRGEDVLERPDWLAGSDISWSKLMEVVDDMESWHEPPSKAGVSFLVYDSPGRKSLD